jgi:hypothetical protein
MFYFDKKVLKIKLINKWPALTNVEQALFYQLL